MNNISKQLRETHRAIVLASANTEGESQVSGSQGESSQTGADTSTVTTSAPLSNLPGTPVPETSQRAPGIISTVTSEQSSATGGTAASQTVSNQTPGEFIDNLPVDYNPFDDIGNGD